MAVIGGNVEGLYALNDNEDGYVWAHGPWPVKGMRGRTIEMGLPYQCSVPGSPLNGPTMFGVIQPP